MRSRTGIVVDANIFFLCMAKQAFGKWARGLTLTLYARSSGGLWQSQYFIPLLQNRASIIDID